MENFGKSTPFNVAKDCKRNFPVSYLILNVKGKL